MASEVDHDAVSIEVEAGSDVDELSQPPESPNSEFSAPDMLSNDMIPCVGALHKSEQVDNMHQDLSFSSQASAEEPKETEPSSLESSSIASNGAAGDSTLGERGGASGAPTGTDQENNSQANGVAPASPDERRRRMAHKDQQNDPRLMAGLEDKTHDLTDAAGK